MPFRLVTLGELSLRDADTGRKLAIPRKALAVMAVLASDGRDGISRERILTLLWPNAEGSGRGALKQTIYELRQTLGNHSVITGTSEMTLDPAEISSDVSELDAAYRAEDSSRVIALYSGPFLDQFHLRDSAEFENWLDRRRQHYNDLFRRSLEKSAITAQQRGDTRSSVDFWKRLSAEDPLDGRITLGVLNALAAAGDAGGALKHYAVHQRLLHDELATEPDAAVTSAAERIRSQNGAPALTVDVRPQIAEPALAPGAADRVQMSAANPQSPARHPWTIGLVFGALLAIIAVVFAAMRYDNKRAHVIESIELPRNTSMRVTIDVQLNRIYADGGASFDHALTIVDGESYRTRIVPHGAGVVVDPLTHWYWSGDYGGRFVVVRNGRTDAEIGRIGVPGCPHQLAAADKWILVAQQCDDHISVIDARSRALFRNIPVATLSRAEVGGAKGMGEIFFNPATAVAYFWKDMIPHRLDTKTWEVRETPGFGGPVMGVDSANNRIYAKIAGGLRVIDGASERIIADLHLPDEFIGHVAVGFGGRRIFAAIPGALAVIDGRTYRVLRTASFSGGFSPDYVAADDSRGRVYLVGAYQDGKRFLKTVDVRD